MIVKPSVQIYSIQIDGIDAKVSARRKGVQAAVNSGVELLELEDGNLSSDHAEGAPEFQAARVVYRHFVSAVDVEGQPFYDASVVISAFMHVNRKAYPISPDDNAIVLKFLDQVFALLMPYSAQKLYVLCYEMGISPEPPVAFFPARHQTGDTNPKSDDSSSS